MANGLLMSCYTVTVVYRFNLEKRLSKMGNLKNPDLDDIIRRIHPECGFYGFNIRFWICPNNAKSFVGFENQDLDFPTKTYP